MFDVHGPSEIVKVLSENGAKRRHEGTINPVVRPWDEKLNTVLVYSKQLDELKV